MRYKLTISYDGTAYAGWQVQPGLPTVQETIENAIAQTIGTRVKIHGSGRTDRGVHAKGQVAHFDAETRMTTRSILFALNSRLPEDIRILSVTRAPSTFHARRTATAKEYRYRIWNSPILPPCERLYACQVHRPLSLPLMQEAAKLFIGTHDFRPFMANPQRTLETTIRTIFEAQVTKSGPRIIFRVKGSGFLYKQVRSMVGLLIRIGHGAEPPSKITELLSTSAPRTARVPSAPPQGLTLHHVWYK